MSNVGFGFEPWDLAEYVWPLVGLLLVVEWLRRIRRAGVTSMRLVGGAALLGAAVLFVRWKLHTDARAVVWGLAALAVFSVVWAVRSYSVTTRPLGRKEKFILILLRCAAAIAIVLFLARPALRWSHVIEDRGTVLVLLDDTRSMTLRDAAETPDGPAVTRLERMRRVLDEGKVALDRIALTRDVQTAAFDTSVHEGDAELLKGQGRYTALASSVWAAFERSVQAGRRVVGVVLVTDGGENYSTLDPLDVAERLRQAQAALWIVGVGSETPAGQTRSLVARRLDVPPRVSVTNRVPVRVELLAHGLAGRDVRVELLYDDQRVEEVTLRPAGVREVLAPALSCLAETEGLHKITVRATAPVLEPDRRTVALSQFVHVTKDTLQVLYVDRPRYERAAIARALAPARELSLTLSQVAMAGGTVVNRLPTRADEWARFDVVILGDVPPEALERTQLEAIRDLVLKSERGFMLIGGSRLLGSPRLAGTPLADIVPVDAATVGYRETAVRIEPTLTGLAHPILRLADPASAPATLRAWPTLPLAPSLALIGKPKPAAQVLLAGTKGEPLLLVQEVGKGRSAALAIDSTWQWAMQLNAGEELHRRFWRQVVLWLANRRPAVWVTTNQPRYQLPRLTSRGETVIVEAGVTTFGASSAPRKIELTGVLKGPDKSSQALSFVRRGDMWEARPAPPKEGEHQIEVFAVVDGVRTDTARAAFVVESPDVEMTEAMANFELLKRMAERTESAGGRFVTADNAGDMFEGILNQQHTVSRTVMETENILDRARTPLLTGILALLVLEWAVRKRRGLA